MAKDGLTQRQASVVEELASIGEFFGQLHQPGQHPGDVYPRFPSQPGGWASSENNLQQQYFCPNPRWERKHHRGYHSYNGG